MINRNLLSLSKHLIDFFNKKELRTSEEEKRYLWSLVVKRANDSKRQKRRLIYYSISSAAAILAAILYFNITSTSQFDESLEDIVASIPQPAPSSDIIMISGKDSIRVDRDTALVNCSDNGEVTINNKAVIKKEAPNQPKEQIAFNQIIVPGGKRTTLTLSDSTKVWINAGSRVVFPQKFAAKERKIYVDGEAYLEVSKNKDKPFIVETPDKFDIRVLGTAFNVCTYSELKHSTVVLAEGKIDITGINKEHKILIPNQLIQIEKEGTLGEVISVDASEYTSWTNGLLVLRSQPFPEVLKRLQIYFGVEMEIEDGLNKTISGQLELKDKLDDILLGMQNIVPYEFSINNDGVYEIKSLQKRE